MHSAASRRASDQRTCGVSYIASALGQQGKPLVWILAYLGQLIDGQGFPPPEGDGTLSGESVWPLSDVEAWFATGAVAA